MILFDIRPVTSSGEWSFTSSTRTVWTVCTSLPQTWADISWTSFDSAFTFIYSKRTGTPAAAMENQVPEDVVKNRFDRLLKEVQDISAEVCGRDVHTVQTVLVEEVNDHSP